MNDHVIYTGLVPIKPPMYSGELDMEAGILTIKRDDKNGKLTHDQVVRLYKKQLSLEGNYE